eukprot:EG_transcript_2929
MTQDWPLSPPSQAFPGHGGPPAPFSPTLATVPADAAVTGILQAAIARFDDLAPDVLEGVLEALEVRNPLLPDREGYAKATFQRLEMDFSAGFLDVEMVPIGHLKALALLLGVAPSEDPDPEELIAALQALAVASAPSNPTSVAPSPASSHLTPLRSDPPPASGADVAGFPWRAESPKPPPRQSRRVLIQQLNEEYAQKRISEEEYNRRWAQVFQEVKDQKAAETAQATASAVAPQAVPWSPTTPNSERQREEGSGLPPYGNPPDLPPETPLTSGVLPIPAFGSPSSKREPDPDEREAPRFYSTEEPGEGEARTSVEVRPSHRAFGPDTSEPAPFKPSPGFIPFHPRHPDPSPHLRYGNPAKPPGPRLNRNPPPPPSRPPNFGEPGVPELPKPLPPQLMTYTAPPLSNGDLASPPEGERAIKYTFDFAANKWAKKETRVRLDLYPFQEGTLRCVYLMKDFSYPPGPMQDFVAKLSKVLDEPEESYFEDCEMQALAGHYAEEFCQLGAPKYIQYIEAGVIECVERKSSRPGGRVLFAVEPFVFGHFIKYTNNYGWVNPAVPRHTPQAFSHFTWCHSQGNLLIVDIQGVTDYKGVDRLTDPQILSAFGPPIYGKADLQMEGIRKFFETHTCNDVCKSLNLPEGIDFPQPYEPPPRRSLPPTIILPPELGGVPPLGPPSPPPPGGLPFTPQKPGTPRSPAPPEAALARPAPDTPPHAGMPPMVVPGLYPFSIPPLFPDGGAAPPPPLFPTAPAGFIPGIPPPFPPPGIPLQAFAPPPAAPLFPTGGSVSVPPQPVTSTAPAFLSTSFNAAFLR